MRITSQQDLARLSIGDRHRAKIEKALKEQANDKARTKKRKAPGASGRQVSTRQGTNAPLTAITSDQQPQDILEALVRTDSSLEHYRWVSNYACAVPMRKFEIDLSIPELRCGVEIDGWQFHGRFKESFLRDREKDYLLTMQGWQILRIQAGLISKDSGEALARVRRFVGYWAPRQQALLAMAF